MEGLGIRLIPVTGGNVDKVVKFSAADENGDSWVRSQTDSQGCAQIQAFGNEKRICVEILDGSWFLPELDDPTVAEIRRRVFEVLDEGGSIAQVPVSRGTRISGRAIETSSGAGLPGVEVEVRKWMRGQVTSAVVTKDDLGYFEVNPTAGGWSALQFHHGRFCLDTEAMNASGIPHRSPFE